MAKKCNITFKEYPVLMIRTHNELEFDRLVMRYIELGYFPMYETFKVLDGVCGFRVFTMLVSRLPDNSISAFDEEDGLIETTEIMQTDKEVEQMQQGNDRDRINRGVH